ncbi:hypothetical protein BKA65DRAFT_515306, partial [Rhexocercosporidium sp. MPI-PUGE-AT-0058]
QLHAPGTVPKTLLRLPLLLVLPPPCCSGTWHPGSRWRPFVQFHCSICCDQCCTEDRYRDDSVSARQRMYRLQIRLVPPYRKAGLQMPDIDIC